MQKKHVDYFDWLRVISAIGVIYMHVASGPLRSSINFDWHFMNIMTSFNFTAVPLFFMMSGYLILNSPKTADVTVLLKKRLPHLVIPLVGWTIVAILWKMVIERNFSASFFINEAISSLYNPAWVHFWYMYSLIVLYIISPVLYCGLKNLDKKGHVLVLSIIVILSVRTMIEGVLPVAIKKYTHFLILTDLDIFGGILSIFVLGYYLGNMKKNISNKILLVFSTGILLVIIIGTYVLTMKNGEFDQTFQYQYSGYEVVLAACIFLLFKQNFNREYKFFRCIPVIPLALSIYLMHGILLSMMMYVFTIKTFWDTIYITILNFVICFFTMKTVATIKPLCFLATGMTYEMACRSCNWIYTYYKIREKIES